MRIRVGLLLAVVLVALQAQSGFAPGAQALPTDDGDPLLVEVTGYDPVNPAPDGSITVTGQVTNRSQRDVKDLTALLRVSGEPLNSRSEVVAVTNQTTSRRGVGVESTATGVAGQLAPAATATVTVTAPVAALPLGANGVYAFFLEVRSSAGSQRTAFPVPWFPAPETLNPSRIVVLNPIRAAVDLTAENTLQSQRLLTSMSSGGPLYDYAAAGARAAAANVPITWLIDPAVSTAALYLASGQATPPADAGDPDAARAAARDWLQTVSAGSSAPSALTYVTPYAEVDAAALISADIADLVGQSVSGAQPAAAASLPVRNGLLAAPPQGNAGTGTLTAYAQAGVTSAILDEAVLPPARRLAYTPSGVAAVPLDGGAETTAIIPDSGLSRALQRPAATPAERFRLQSGLLAEAAMITLELPLSSRTVVMLPASGTPIPPDIYADLLTALNRAPYIRLAPLPALFEPEVPRVERRLTAVAPEPPPLSQTYLAPVPPLQQRLDAFGDITVDPLAFEQDYRAAILRSASANWRPDTERGSRLLASVGDDLAVQEQKVTTVSTGNVTFTGSTGTLPLTISNQLDQAVDVQVVLEADPAVRLTYTPPGLVRVDAGKRVSIEVPVEVFGNGPLPVSVILSDREGRPFLITANLVIRATGASVVAGIVAVLGAVALLVLVLWRFRRKGADRDEPGA